MGVRDSGMLSLITPPAPDLKGKGGRTIPPKPGPMTYCSVTLVSYLTSRIGAPPHRVVVRIEIIL